MLHIRNFENKNIQIIHLSKSGFGAQETFTNNLAVRINSNIILRHKLKFERQCRCKVIQVDSDFTCYILTILNFCLSHGCCTSSLLYYIERNNPAYALTKKHHIHKAEFCMNSQCYLEFFTAFYVQLHIYLKKTPWP